MRTVDGLDRLLACQFAAAVDAEWVGPVVLVIRRGLTAVEHIVGGVMEQRHAEPGGFLGEDAGRRGVDCKSQFGLALGLVDGGVCGGIDDQLGAQFAHLLANLCRLGQVELFAAADDQVALPT
ncbi:hypothetical protein D9M68_860880 [compost metagenome]